ncbi:MAG: hypothetical protein H7222_15880 [Methylotenera sp.]|nr:hypothetical protein [Oligoflexia bacterium]
MLNVAHIKSRIGQGVLLFAVLPASAFLIAGCEVSTEVTREVTAKPSVTPPVDPNSVPINYAGILNPASAITKVSATVGLLPVDAAAVKIYCRAGAGAYTLSATVLGSVSSASLPGLTPATSYTCAAHALNPAGLEDLNTATVSFATQGALSQGYQNVILVQAFGSVSASVIDSTVAADLDFAAGMPTASKVSITWAPFVASEVNPSTIYRVLRVASGVAIPNVNITNACALNSTAPCVVNCGQALSGGSAQTCIDLMVVSALATDTPDKAKTFDYFLTVKKADGTYETSPSTALTENPYRVKVPIPPLNMVLVHRESVNYETCKHMGQNPDALNHNSCAYTGSQGLPLNTGPSKQVLSFPQYAANSVFDFGYHLFIDRWEAACNWNLSGSSVPGAGLGTVGDVYYDTTLGNCMLKTGAAQWSKLDSASLSASNPYLPNLYTNGPGNSTNFAQRRVRPPLVNVIRSQAVSICDTQTAVGYGHKRLLRRREFVAAAAWPSLSGEPGAKSANDIEALEPSNTSGRPSTIANPLNHPCNNWLFDVRSNSTTNSTYNNASFNSGTSNPFGDLARIADSNGALYSSSTAPTVGTAVTIGSQWTSNCVSRFGAQDLIGNVWEFNADEFSSSGGTQSSTDNGADLSSYVTAAALGSCGSLRFNASSNDNACSSPSANLNLLNFNPVLGLPDLRGGLNSITSFPEVLIGLGNHVQIDSGNAKVVLSGGGGRQPAGYGGGNFPGRYSMWVVPSTNSRDDIGFRCATEAE